MGTNFRKFKAGIGTVTAILSALLGLSVGGFFSSLIWLLSKLAVVEAAPIYYILSVLLGLLVGVVAYLTHIPTDKKVAMKLDGDLALGERARTMVEFALEDSAMHQVQRMDTEERLGASSFRGLRYGKLWLHALAPMIALAMLISAIAVPAVADQPHVEDSDPLYTFTPWQRQALIDLIEEVEASDMATVPKTVSVTELALLVTVLDNVERVSGMKAAVNTALGTIYSAVDVSNTADHVSKVLKDTDNERMSNLSIAIENLGALLVTEELTSLRTEILAPDGSQVLAAFVAALNTAVNSELFRTLPDGDPLCEALIALDAALSDVDISADPLPVSEIDAAISKANGDIGAALLTQSVNESMEGRISRRLMEIFGLKLSDITAGGGAGAENGSGDDDGSGDLIPDDENNSAGGGLGTGDMIFGSNDLIYDPRTNSYVPYGDVIYDYHAIATQKIVDISADRELEDIITRYFNSLYGSVDGEDE